MEKIVIKGMICAQKDRWNESVSYTFVAGEKNCMAEYGYMEVCKHTIEFDIPADFNIVSAQVNALNAAKETLQKEFGARVREINDQIANLLCLTFDPAPSGDAEPSAPQEDFSEIPF
jgi:hypothetical protein